LNHVFINLKKNGVLMKLQKHIVRPAELAAILGVSTVTLWNWRRKGILPEPATYGPRFIGWPQSIIDDWFESQEGEVS
jgi:predicted DNA-binding transcriptional regulator AlpA